MIKQVEANVGVENRDLYLLFIDAYVALLQDSPIDQEKPLRLIRSFLSKLLLTPARELILGLASLADEIIESLDSTSDMTITGLWCDGMRDLPVFREYLHFYRTSDASAFRYILSFLWFGKKMDYLDLDLELFAFRDWLQIERDMDSFVVDEELAQRLRIIIPQLLGSFEDGILLPKNGPGSTSEGFVDPNDKLDHMSFDTKSRYAFRSGSFGRTGVNRLSLSRYSQAHSRELVARLKFVPKTVKTMRSICMEPISRMFLQQEVSRWLITAMEDGPISSIVTLKDQSHNRDYALAASFSQSCATIDLSAASDRIHIDLIKRIMPSKILYYLLGTRTKKVDTGESIVQLNKFAPMGSALCFPVQSIVFTAIVLLGYLEHYYSKRDKLKGDSYYLHHIKEFIRGMGTDPSQYDPNKLLRPRVYGDDIICDERITGDILILLARAGLVVNERKSFTGGTPFRESCGIFALNGVDVSPFLFRVKSHKDKLSASTFAGIVDAANRAGDYKYHTLRSCFINYLKRSRVYGFKGDISPYIHFTRDRNVFGIYSTSPKNQGATRYNTNYQRDEVRRLVIRSHGSSRSISQYAEDYAFDQWMRARIRGGSTEYNYSVSRVRPRESRVRLDWLPVE